MMRWNYPNAEKHLLQVINQFLQQKAFNSVQSISQPGMHRDEEILTQIIIITALLFLNLKMQ